MSGKGGNMWKDERGLSRVEVICITGITAFFVVALFLLAAYALGLFRTGDDTMTLNTADSVAYTQMTSNCMVPGCSGTGAHHESSHIDVNGYTFAYYDKVANTLTDVRPSGYNEGSVLPVDGRDQQVEPNTMVIVARSNGEDYWLSWESEVSLLAK